MKVVRIIQTAGPGPTAGLIRTSALHHVSDYHTPDSPPIELAPGRYDYWFGVQVNRPGTYELRAIDERDAPLGDPLVVHAGSVFGPFSCVFTVPQ